MNITIYHNPSCSTSRKVLGLIRSKGIEPEVVEYLVTPLSRTKLAELAKKIDVSIQEMIRLKEDLFSKMKLGNSGTTDDDLLDAMALFSNRKLSLLITSFAYFKSAIKSEANKLNLSDLLMIHGKYVFLTPLKK